MPRETFKTVSSKYFNTEDDLTLKVITSINEADQNHVLESLTSKLYDVIVKKYYDIDFGNIPDSKGDITKIQNYDDLVSTCELMKDIVLYYRQKVDIIESVINAIENVKQRYSLWKRGYDTNTQLPCMIYEVTTLSIVSSISLLISTCIEYIKSSDTESFEISLNKFQYSRSSSSLLLKDVQHFNSSCANGDLDKSLNYIMDTKNDKYRHNGPRTTKVSIGTAVIGVVGFVTLISVILPYIREAIYYFFLTKQNISDYFELQANLLLMNSANIQYRDDIDEETKQKIIGKQTKIADMFRTISNKFAIDSKKGEIEAERELNRDNVKYDIDEIMDEIPDSADISSGIF